MFHSSVCQAIKSTALAKQSLQKVDNAESAMFPADTHVRGITRTYILALYLLCWLYMYILYIVEDISLVLVHSCADTCTYTWSTKISNEIFVWTFHNLSIYQQSIDFVFT